MHIRRASESDVPELMAFIGKHWKHGHVLSTSRALMDWQHRDPEGGYTYLLAEDQGELLGVLGYIPTRVYDSTAANVVWLALWKIRDDIRRPGLGLQMLRVLEGTEAFEAIAVNGINQSIPPLYKALGYNVVELEQLYVTNPNVPKTLLQGEQPWPQPKSGEATIRCLCEQELLELQFTPTALPAKTPLHFTNRFLRHPFYNYSVHLLEFDKRQALIATRIAEHGTAKALRIVDFSGDAQALAESGQAIRALLDREQAEYVDIWHHGISSKALAQAGFTPVTQETIVPNYFEPFHPANGRIIGAYKTNSNRPLVICRADGDQDRPSQLPSA